jgi:LacI family transcriptional regulator
LTTRQTPDKVTLADVASRAGVSTMTVSRVVNGLDGVGEQTRRRVREAIDELGYRPNIVARGLKASRSGTVGLLVTDITNPYFPEIVRGAEDVAFGAGYTVFLNNVLEDVEREAQALLALEDRRVDGVIACSPRLTDERLQALLLRHGAAVVVNRWAPAEVAGSVRVEHRLGARLAVQHLHALGRRRLAVLAGPEHSHAGRERLEGMAETAAELGLELPPQRLIHGQPTVEGGQAAAARLLEASTSVDALLCFNDVMAAGALQELRCRGVSVPDDIAVVGYDDIPFARMFTPSLTTLHVPTYELGMHAMRVLLDRMEGRHQQVSIVFQPELIVRESTVGAGAPGPRELARSNRQ